MSQFPACLWSANDISRVGVSLESQACCRNRMHISAVADRKRMSLLRLSSLLCLGRPANCWFSKQHYPVPGSMLSRWTFSGYMDHAPHRCLSNASDGVLDDHYKAYPDLVYTLHGRLGGPAEYKGEKVIEPKHPSHFCATTPAARDRQKLISVPCAFSHQLIKRFEIYRYCKDHRRV
jgi:hypothetical protein